MQSQRRSYSKSFKAQVVQECAQPGASIASVAQKHSLNANLVHKWIRVLTNKTMALQPAYIPVPLHPRGTVKVNWPTESAVACATFLRDLLE